MRISPVRRLGTALITATMLAAMATASVSAHSQTVDPNGNGAGFTKPISNAWAQAHCNARSPAIVFGASNGVVAFNPPAALPCPAVTNPGGQIHGG